MTQMPDDGDLRKYKYAPGDYSLQCCKCNNIVGGVDKGALTCKSCATDFFWRDLVKARDAEIARQAALIDEARKVIKEFTDADTENEPLNDCVDNLKFPYQSQWLADKLKEAREWLERVK